MPCSWRISEYGEDSTSSSVCASDVDDEFEERVTTIIESPPTSPMPLKLEYARSLPPNALRTPSLRLSKSPVANDVSHSFPVFHPTMINQLLSSPEQSSSQTDSPIESPSTPDTAIDLDYLVRVSCNSLFCGGTLRDGCFRILALMFRWTKALLQPW